MEQQQQQQQQQQLRDVAQGLRAAAANPLAPPFFCHHTVLCLLVSGVSVVEDLDKAREPLPLAAVYFITPSPAAVTRLLADFATKPLYPSVHVFFSNRVSADAVDRIKKCKVGL
jgi:hypothetical protein